MSSLLWKKSFQLDAAKEFFNLLCFNSPPTSFFRNYSHYMSVYILVYKRINTRIYREYFVESVGVWYLRTSKLLRSLVRFLIQKQRVCKYRIKHFPCGYYIAQSHRESMRRL